MEFKLQSPKCWLNIFHKNREWILEFSPLPSSSSKSFRWLTWIWSELQHYLSNLKQVAGKFLQVSFWHLENVRICSLGIKKRWWLCKAELTRHHQVQTLQWLLWCVVNSFPNIGLPDSRTLEGYIWWGKQFSTRNGYTLTHTPLLFPSFCCPGNQETVWLYSTPRFLWGL